MDKRWLDEVKWSDEGLVPVVVQDQASGRVLMQAWMNREALERTAQTGQAVYWSRSRRELWRKGEQSGHTQEVRELRLDCDGDSLLLTVVQHGLACHTGRASCYFRRWEAGAWRTVDPVLKEPADIYGEPQP